MTIDQFTGKWSVFSFIIFLLLQGCCAAYKPGIWDADTITLYSIDGNKQPGSPGYPGGAAELFHGWPVLGKANVDQVDDQKKLREALNRGIEGNDGMVAGCFIPRHGIRSVKGPHTTDYVICFECMQIEVHENGKVSQLLTTASPRKTFDDFFKKMNVPLAP